MCEVRFSTEFGLPNSFICFSLLTSHFSLPNGLSKLDSGVVLVNRWISV